MMTDQFAPIDKPYLDQWRKRLDELDKLWYDQQGKVPKKAKKPRKKGKKAKVRK